MPMKNRLRDKIDNGEPVLGAWLAFPDTHSAELMSRLGFDWATIDGSTLSTWIVAEIPRCVHIVR